MIRPRFVRRFATLSPIFWVATGFVSAFLLAGVLTMRDVEHISTFRFRLSPSRSDQDSGHPSNHLRVLYTVRTCPKYYESRVKDALTTYLTEVHSNLILLVGNTPHTVSVPDRTNRQHLTSMRNLTVQSTDGSDGFNGTVCEDNHSEGVTCIEGRALFFAYQRRELFDWIFMVDDDVYVHRHNVEMTVHGLNPMLPLVYTVGGCAPKVPCARAAGGGICGGGGYFLSRQSLERAVCGMSISTKGKKNGLCSRSDKRSQDDMLSEWMKSWMKMGAEVARADGGWWSDITAGCVLYSRGGIKTHGMEGLHPWELNATQVIYKLTHEAPLSFHYVHRGEMPGMQAMHKLVTGTNRNATANADKYADNIVHVPNSTPNRTR